MVGCLNKFMRAHPRLSISAAIGAAVYFLLPAHWTPLIRALVCWNCAVALFLTLVAVWMSRLSAEQLCSKYDEEDESSTVILVLVTVAALFSLVAIVEPLATIKQSAGMVRVAHFGIAALTLVNSWLLVGVSGISSLPTSFYGQFLLAKVGLFLAMLVLAAANRFRLTPALSNAMARDDHAAAICALRWSLGFEASLAVIVLGIVALLGTLEPIATAG